MCVIHRTLRHTWPHPATDTHTRTQHTDTKQEPNATQRKPHNYSKKPIEMARTKLAHRMSGYRGGQPRTVRASLPPPSLDTIFEYFRVTRAQATIYAMMQGKKQAEREELRLRVSQADFNVVVNRISENTLRQFYPDTMPQVFIDRLPSFDDFWRTMYKTTKSLRAACKTIQYFETISSAHGLAYCEFAYGGSETVAPERAQIFNEIKVDIDSGHQPHPTSLRLDQSAFETNQPIKDLFSQLIYTVDFGLTDDQADYYENLIGDFFTDSDDEVDQHDIDIVKGKMATHTLGHVGEIHPIREAPGGVREYATWITIWEARQKDNVEEYLLDNLDHNTVRPYLNIADGIDDTSEFALQLHRKIQNRELMHPKYLRITSQRFPDINENTVRHIYVDQTDERFQLLGGAVAVVSGDEALQNFFRITAILRTRPGPVQPREDRTRGISDAKAIELLTDTSCKECQICMATSANCKIIHKIKHGNEKAHSCNNHICWSCMKKAIKTQRPNRGLIQPQCPFCRQKIDKCVKYKPDKPKKHARVIHLPPFDPFASKLPSVYRKKVVPKSKKKQPSTPINLV